MANELTPVDIRILEVIQNDASLSTADLAEKVGISHSPCWRRLQRLKEEGYIDRQVAILNREKFGQEFLVFAFVKVAALSPEQRKEFHRKIENLPHIIECYSVLGEYDLIIKVMASSLKEYQNFIFDTVMRLPGVQDVRSTAALSVLKDTTAIPVRGIMSR
ncbi:Lrp/AsnC family transcriptional regulator [Gluconobacter sphaericus]|uniref:AsnC family transcriptional regulator n=1 Tax=Gluconobacter sphaericus NBRC 12467 TaxID=1307951 RepID=A0AA37SEA6_9PROT|nr:Lrp/AsnC family transcriptional regulator [Gluconobacter sphaericus]MBF0885852.1 Lrp/AsnC family transcriptional regulator [Gluconobacter sphaericus]GBR55213.1 AsnC family transcriptional regulator [Gluconobacter sphaericus NBRC 12467]GEB43909.1 AsnC family transcriptional regulator [Gluconobacter sphaericus NBRC 12467]GLQ83156.1 AsnC family transcriptional regulator [Gluconobacter sphaericus NBRC 12467]